MTPDFKKALNAFKQDYRFPVMDTLPPIIPIESLDEDDFKAIRAALKLASAVQEGRKAVLPIPHAQAMLSAVMQHVEHIDHAGASILTIGWYEAMLKAAPDVWSEIDGM